ncbi:MAG: bifunctional UDP-N-acetylglucosamine diphosphorylase/glucosamine-1-phosphate N-acetyltransferase GlmU [Actinobacteria bacterium]|nr:bifunctional UDP-N-acetylglucosamine diphosphorylase/glucosamine-1-phosphate N-acetyltransferase GlmU [Actinomycetota bacterium]
MTQTVASDTRAALVIVLAAGAGTRMKSGLAKVLHTVVGIPLLGHVMRAASETNPEHIVVVVGHQRDQVTEFVTSAYPGVVTAIQEEQNGTGHAVRCALESLDSHGIDAPEGPVVVIAGDTPLLTGATLQNLINAQAAAGASATVLSAIFADATGYGRIVRDEFGDLTGIVEQKDATAAQQKLTEINSGMYAFDARQLGKAINQLTTDNSQGEEYLTDVIGILRADGQLVTAHIIDDSDEVHGVNDRLQLASSAALLRERTNAEFMRSGVTIIDPATTWITPGAVIEADAVIERNTSLDGQTVIASGAVVGPDTTLLGCRVGVGAAVVRSHCDHAQIGDGAKVGPFTYLRPGSVLGPESKVGAYVEVKKSTIGAQSKVPHLSYVGDAQIGVGTNIGAATIFANYDGEAKHKTVVGDHVRVGSDSILVAPVTIGDGAYTAAGSVITHDVAAGAIGIARGRQANIDEWVAHNRPGSQSAAAAARAVDPSPEQEPQISDSSNGGRN